MTEKVGAVLFSAEQIQGRVRAIGVEITELYAGKPLVMICVLKGAFMFFADLLRHTDLSPELDFVRIASYGSGTSAGRAISFTKDIEVPLHEKHVLVVEDIVDTGRSMDFLLRQLEARGAASIRLCALIDKRERRETRIEVDFAGFKLSDGFIIGYGLDYAEKYRGLPDIRLLDLS